MIFVKDPYFNEPGFERYQGTDRGDEYSRKYNLQIEHATLNYAIREQLKKPSEHFKVGKIYENLHINCFCSGSYWETFVAETGSNSETGSSLDWQC